MNFSLPTTTDAALVAGLALDMQQVVAGNPFTATVTITNYGVVASKPGIAELVWTSGRASAPTIHSSPPINVPAIAPGQTWTGNYTVDTPPNVYGSLNVGVIADVTNATPQVSNLYETDQAAIEADYPPDKLEDNNSFDDATELGGLVQAITENNVTIDSSNDVDYYHITLPTQGTAADTVTVRRSDSDGPIGFAIYDANDNQVLSATPDFGDTTTTGTEQLSLAGLAAGSYYIEVFSSDGTPFPYSMTLTSGPRSGPNLGVQSVVVTDPNLTPGDQQMRMSRSAISRIQRR